MYLPLSFVESDGSLSTAVRSSEPSQVLPDTTVAAQMIGAGFRAIAWYIRLDTVLLWQNMWHQARLAGEGLHHGERPGQTSFQRD